MALASLTLHLISLVPFSPENTLDERISLISSVILTPPHLKKEEEREKTRVKSYLAPSSEDAQSTAGRQPQELCFRKKRLDQRHMPAPAAAWDFWALLVVHSSHRKDRTQLQTHTFVQSLTITEHHYGVADESLYVFIEAECSIKIKTAFPSRSVCLGSHQCSHRIESI